MLWAIAVATVVSAALWAGNDYTREALAARAGAGAEVRATVTHASLYGGCWQGVAPKPLFAGCFEEFVCNGNNQGWV